MNNGATNGGAGSHALSEVETRIVAWIAGEASASERAELEGLAAAKPELAAFRRRVEAMQRLAAEAVAPDMETLRLSEERRAELMETFGAMRRRNLIFAAICSVLIVVGVARLGEITHFIPPVHATARTDFLPAFTIEPDPPVAVEVDPLLKETKPDIGPPEIPDSPVKPRPDNPFTVPIEPPPAVIDNTLTKIPVDRRTGPEGPPTFNLSQLDERPVAKYMARPVYPESMRRNGISGEGHGRIHRGSQRQRAQRDRRPLEPARLRGGRLHGGRQVEVPAGPEGRPRRQRPHAGADRLHAERAVRGPKRARRRANGRAARGPGDPGASPYETAGACHRPTIR
jgi:protein TonB